MRRRPTGLVLAAGALVALAACAELDHDRSVRTFHETHRQAERGSASAAADLAHFHRLGIGTARDPEKAVYWYERAGEHGWKWLGDMYATGADVPRDADRAAAYYRLAAERGDPLAMYGLGCLHAERRVSAPDVVDGYAWLRLAHARGTASANCVLHVECDEWAIKDTPGCRKALASELTAAQRAEAEQRAADWLAAWSRSKK
jgi:TPR repeat protein